MSATTQVPTAVATYFGISGYDASEHPVVAQVFKTGLGWKVATGNELVSVAGVRKLRREGVTGVALVAHGRQVDFSVGEILRASGADTQILSDDELAQS